MDALETLKNYNNFAVIGVSNDTSKFSYKIYNKLKELNKNVYGISPKYTSIDNDVIYSSLKDIPHCIDVVVFVVNKKFALPYILEINKLHLNIAWMQPNTYDDELLKTIESYNINTICDCVLVQSKRIND